jgi:hypothetical protein
MSVTRSPQANPALARSITAWRDAGIITAEQAVQIESFERAAIARMEPSVAPARPRRVPFVAEALGYLGGILGIVGLVLLVARYWPDMATGMRLGLGLACMSVFGIAGYLVHEHVEPALDRLRWFLWVLSSAAGALLAGVFVHQVLDSGSPRSIILGGAAMVTAQNSVLWAARERPIQQFLTLTGLVTTAGLAMAQIADEGPTGIVVMAVGAPMLLAGWLALSTTPPITAGVGAGATIVGAMLVASAWQTPGLLVAVSTAAMVMLLAALRHGTRDDGVRVVLTVVGALGLLFSVPGTIGFYAERAGIPTGAAVWGIGGTLVMAGGQRLTRAPRALEAVGGLAIVGGAAVTAAQSVAFATLFGLATAVALIALGTVPGRVLMSLFGSLGLLVNVPWSILHFFPGEGRAPLLILASGTVIVAVAVWLARMGGRLRRELRG